MSCAQMCLWPVVLTFSLTSQASLYGRRSFAQLVVRELWHAFPNDCGLSSQEAAFQGMRAFLRTNSDFQKLVSATGGPFSDVDAIAFCTPQGVFGQVGEFFIASHCKLSVV